MSRGKKKLPHALIGCLILDKEAVFQTAHLQAEPALPASSSQNLCAETLHPSSNMPNSFQSITLTQTDFISNCTASGSFFGARDAWVSEQSRSYPYEQLAEFLHQVAPTAFENVSLGAIIHWYNDQELEANFTAAQDGVWTGCRADFCRNVGWHGNPDLAGIGVRMIAIQLLPEPKVEDPGQVQITNRVFTQKVIISYCTEVILATIFVAAHVFYEARHGAQLGAPLLAEPSDVHAAWAAIHTSFVVFWDSALLFAMSICIAVMVIQATDSSYHTLLFMSYTSLLTTWVPIFTWIYVGGTCRYRSARMAAMIFTSLVSFISSVQLTWRLWSWHAVLENPFSNTGSAFDGVCLKQSISTDSTLKAVLWFGVFGFVASMLLFWSHFACPNILTAPYFRCLGQGRSRSWLNLPRQTDRGLVFRFICGGLPALFKLLFAYCSLAFVVLYRYKISSVSGVSFQENEWGFGQVLAILTWLPTILDFGMVWKGKTEHSPVKTAANLEPVGHVEGLKYRLPLGLQVRSERESRPGEELAPLVAANEWAR